MTNKELKKLSRAELLELLLVQTRESELLRLELEEVRQRLENRQLQIREAGNLAEAVLSINGVMESAQKAAAQYLENIGRMEAQTRAQCQQMLRDAAEEAEVIKQEAARGLPVFRYQIEEIEQPEPEERCPDETPAELPMVPVSDRFFEKAVQQIRAIMARAKQR